MLGLKLANVVAGAVGSFVSLNFFDNLTRLQRWSTFIGGWAMGAWLAEPLTVALELPAKVELGIALVTALFGMSIAAQLIKVQWMELLWATCGKFGINRKERNGHDGHDDNRGQGPRHD